MRSRDEGRRIGPLYSYREVLWLIGQMTDRYGLALLIGVVESDKRRYTVDEVAWIGHCWQERFYMLQRRRRG